MDRPRQKPRRLAEKLLHIRRALNLSQNQMIKRLGFDGELIQAHISAYERKHENRVPPLGVVLQYARCAGVPMEMIVDDNLDLPDKLPASSQEQVPRQRFSKAPSSRTGGASSNRAPKRPR